MDSKIKAQRYIDSIVFSNECYAEIREVARRAYQKGYEDAAGITGGIGTEMVSSRQPIKDISVKAYCKTSEHMGVQAPLGKYRTYNKSKLLDIKNDYIIFAGKKVSSKWLAKELRGLNYYVENIGGTVWVEHWTIDGSEQPVQGEVDIDNLPF